MADFGGRLIALADGQGAVGFGIVFLGSAVYAVNALVRLIRGHARSLPREPVANTRAGQVAFLVLSSSITLFALVCLLLAL
jgi:hypothetical protein